MTTYNFPDLPEGYRYNIRRSYHVYVEAENPQRGEARFEHVNGLKVEIQKHSQETGFVKKTVRTWWGGTRDQTVKETKNKWTAVVDELIRDEKVTQESVAAIGVQLRAELDTWIAKNKQAIYATSFVGTYPPEKLEDKA